MSRIRVALVALVGLVAPLLLLAGPPASAACTSSYRTMTGTLLGSDGRYVNALMGFAFRNADRQPINATYGSASFGCTGQTGYGAIVKLNTRTPATGSTYGVKDWSLKVPINAASVYIEVYPKNERYVTDESRYGHAMRRFAVPYSSAVTIRLPLICSEGGTTGGIWGYAKRGGVRAPLQRIAAWSLAPDNNTASPILGWTVGVTGSNGFFHLANLAANQPYIILATMDGVTQHVWHVGVNPCRNTPIGIYF